MTSCVFKGPEVVVEQSHINFGLVRLGETVEATMTIRNTSRVPAKWTCMESPEHEQPVSQNPPPPPPLPPLPLVLIPLMYLPNF